MANVPLVRADYERLNQLAQKFASQAEVVNALYGKLSQRIQTLRDGDWEGEGARAFYREMEQDLLPGVKRLGTALETSQQATLQISRIFKNAEDETAALFRAGNANPNGSHQINPDFSGVDNTKGVQYTLYNGQLFIQGGGDAADVDPNDISQGMLGDCYFMASLASVANNKPDLIKNMLHQNTDGTYTVSFYEKRNPLAFWDPEFKKVDITVDGNLPTKNGSLYFAAAGDSVNGAGETWSAIVEKAYAKWKGGYENIEGGWTHDALQMISGKASTTIKNADLTWDDVKKYANGQYGFGAESHTDYKLEIGGKTLIDFPDEVSKLDAYKNSVLVGGHSYYVTGVDEATKEVIIHNPWGWNSGSGEIRMGFDDFKKNFQKVSVNPL
jgi:WXG100 family type VII secretion target